MARYTWERRNELARERGWSGATEQENALSYARESRDFSRLTGIGRGKIRADRLTRDETALVRLYYQAFHLQDPDDYSLQTRNGKPTVRIVNGVPRGARAKWLIDIAQYVDDSQEWRRRYPNGVREGITSSTTVERVLSFGGD